MCWHNNINHGDTSYAYSFAITENGKKFDVTFWALTNSNRLFYYAFEKCNIVICSLVVFSFCMFC